MSYDLSDILEVKVSVAIKVVEHLLAICRGCECNEWLKKFLAVRDALVSGRLKDAVREEARLTPYTSPAKWVGSRYMEKRLQDVMGVLHRQISYPNHSEPPVEIGELPNDVTVDCETQIRARQVELEARQIELATVGYLNVAEGLFAGQMVALRAGETLVGCHDSCQICLADPDIDRIQVSIVEHDGEFLIAALSTNNPIWLNGTRINFEQTELKDSDLIQINGHTFQFFRRVPNPCEAQVTPVSLRPQSMRNAWKLAEKAAVGKSSLDNLLNDISHRGLDVVMAEELRPGLPRHRWRIDVVELGFLKKMSANPDETSNWHAYMDWLEEHDVVRGEFLRAMSMLSILSNRDDRFQNQRRHCLELWARVDPEWGLAMLEMLRSRILNCGGATSREPPLRFAFQCPNQWDSLAPGVDPNVRFCQDCSKSVYFCRTVAEAESHGKAGNCIAISSRAALQVQATADHAERLMWPIGMTLGLASSDKSNPLEQPPDDQLYRTWADILFVDGK